MTAFDELVRTVAPDVTLHPYMEPVEAWYCACGCLFLPQHSGDEVYLDRFEMAGGCDNFGLSPSCACHNLPALVREQRDGGTSTP